MKLVGGGVELDPLSVPDDPDDPDVPVDASILKTGLVGSCEVAAIFFVRSSVVGPELRCCKRVASTAESPGLVAPKAQMMSLLGVDGAGIENTSFGLVPVRSLNALSRVAVRGGLGSTVGMTSDGALRCERVIEPSEFGHIMTIGVFAICEPNPLAKRVSYEHLSEDGKPYMAIHPSDAAPRLWRVSNKIKKLMPRISNTMRTYIVWSFR